MDKLAKEYLYKFNSMSGAVLCLLLLLCSMTVGCTFAAELNLNSPKAQELIAEVNAMGVVRVIVTLALDAKGEDDKLKIKKAQEELLKELSLFRVKKIKRYKYFPILALEVGPGALGYLLVSPAISSVSADVLAQTMGISSHRQLQVEE